VDGRRFDENLRALCDLDLLLRVSRALALHHQREPLLRYHAGAGISTNLDAVASAREYLLAKHREHFRGQSHCLAYQYSKISTARLQAGQTAEARRAALRAIRARPLSPWIAARALPALLGLRAAPRIYIAVRRLLQPRAPHGWVP
jgi:hypothetical protein